MPLEVSSGFEARNNNPRIPVAKQNQIEGGFHQYDTLEEFVQLHPNKMKVGMQVVVNQHDRSGVTFPQTTYKLATILTEADWPLEVNPNLLDGGGNEVIPITPNPKFFLNYWREIEKLTLIQSEYEIEYAPDINGLKPRYPYIDFPADEASWSDTYVPGVSKWYRERNNGEVDGGTGIYLNWTVPISINGNFEGQDYVQNLFQRSASIPTLPSQYTKTGQINNEPAGWSDIPPVGVDPLYEIRAQKDKYGNLKSAWIGPFLIPEDADLVRYNSQSVPNPNTLAGINDIATTGSAPDLALVAEGWVETFDPAIHAYRALREEVSPGLYTTWTITKISEESGEYIDRIYKLFDINQDFDSTVFIAANTPTGNNPITTQGWSDIPLEETDTQINGYSEARKFIDGSLKTPWTSPRPFTGKDSFNDYISSQGETSFKYPNKAQAGYTTVANGLSPYADIAALIADQGSQVEGSLYQVEDASPNATGRGFFLYNGVANGLVSDYTFLAADPSSITLEMNVFKGLNEITTGLTYKWYKVYNNRTITVVDPEVDAPISTSKSLTIFPTDVQGKAIFRCYATLTIDGGTDIVFEEEESITDITDGDDAKALVLSTDSPLVVYDSGGAVYSVDTVFLRARQSFLDGVTFYWYKDDGAGNWVALTNGVGGYTLTNQTLSIDPVDLFAEDGTKQTARYAISTSSSTLTVEDVDEFYDTVTISKLGSAGVGSPGADAITIVLSNEVDSIILDEGTLLPIAGEVGASGRIKTLIRVFNGTTEIDYGTGWTITSLTSDTANVTFAHQDAGSLDREVYVATWTSTIARKANATMTINVVGVGNFTKNFTVSSALDTAGAIIANIEVDAASTNQSLAFSSTNSSDIRLVARLYQNGNSIGAGSWDGNVLWKIGVGTKVGVDVNDRDLLVTRADVNGSAAVQATITYKGKTYVSSPVSIDDITDGQLFILYSIDNPATNSVTFPTKPSNSTVSTFTSDYANTGTTNNTWVRTPNNTLSYYYSIGQVTPGTNTIVFANPLKYRGESGTNGGTGWTMNLSLALKTNGTDYVLAATYVGGTGSPPFSGTRYLTSGGGYTTNKDAAQRINGTNGTDGIDGDNQTSDYFKLDSWHDNGGRDITFQSGYIDQGTGLQWRYWRSDDSNANNLYSLTVTNNSSYSRKFRFRVSGLVGAQDASAVIAFVGMQVTNTAASFGGGSIAVPTVQAKCWGGGDGERSNAEVTTVYTLAAGQSVKIWPTIYIFEADGGNGGRVYNKMLIEAHTI